MSADLERSPPATRSEQRWILLAAILGSAIVFLDGTVVNVALHRIGQDLPSRTLPTLEALVYVYSGYLLTLSSLIVLAGAIGDGYGRRRTFALGLAGFGGASLLCGLAPGLEALIGFRLLQGAAGALLVPGSLALLRVSFEGPALGRAYGIWAAGTSLTTLAGPFLGGLLVDAVSWRAVFLVNVPLVLAALAATARVPESRSPSRSPLDWTGALLFALAAGGLSFGVVYGQSRGWRGAPGWIAVGLGLLAAAGLPAWLRRARHPLVPPALFRSRTFTTVNLSTLAIYGALYVYAYYLPLFLQGVAGYTAAAAGLASLPGALLMIALSPRAGRLAAEFGPRLFLVSGPLLMAAGLAWLVRVPPGTPAWQLQLGRPESLPPPAGYLVDLLPASLLFGLGLGLLVTPLTAALMSSVPAANAGVASAFNNAVSRVGPQLAGALVFVGVTEAFFAALGSRPAGLSPFSRPAGLALVGPALLASTVAFRLAAAICVGLLVLGAAVNLVGIRGRQAAE